MILSLLFYAFLAYLLYRLVFSFIIPIYRTTKQVKKGFRDMQEQMRQHTGPQDQPPQNPRSAKPNTTKVGDYIDFEEVKD
jgi:hypothetical protein